MKNWDLTHNPEVRPIGCNGRYGQSGVSRHYHRGTKTCKRCLKSAAHYQRERRRGSGLGPRKLKPCGTIAAAARHRRKGEPLCFPCKVARHEYDKLHPSKKRKQKSNLKMA